MSEFADAVELPPLPEGGGPPPAGDKLALGKVRLAPGAKLGIALLGGTDVPRGGCKFVLEPDAADPSGAAWLIRGQSEAKAGASPTRHDVARLWLDGQTLSFAWLSGAAGASPGYLRNCGLLVSAGGASAICRSAGRSPSRRSCWTRTAPSPGSDFKRLDLPEAAALRLQITGFSDAFPNPAMPSDTVAAKKKIDVSFGDPKLPKVIAPRRIRAEGAFRADRAFAVVPVAGPDAAQAPANQGDRAVDGADGSRSDASQRGLDGSLAGPEGPPAADGGRN